MERNVKRLLLLVSALVACAAAAHAQNATPLWVRGYSVVPTPRNVQVGSRDLTFGGEWTIAPEGPAASNMAVRSLVRDAAEFHGVTLRRAAGSKAIRLAVKPGAVATKAEADLDVQAYRLRITPAAIEITGNGEPGLFYGVQTLVQLMRRDGAGRLTVPECTIEDWPKLQLRFLHWDTKHHQDRMETLKRYLDWSARMKANVIGFEVEDKFEYPSHPVVGAPGAFTAAQLQEIVDYGLERHIQVVPVIQSPAHMTYVLKHPEFADLRADGNNYQSKMCDPRTYELLFSLYDDVIKATKGVKYFFVSTDEVYYAGIEGTCRPYNEENRSLIWAEFVQKAHAHLAKHGRRMLIWAEYPLLPKHMEMIPADVIDGVVGNPGYVPIQKKKGMRQLAYVSMQGGELLFPSHLGMETERGYTPGHLEGAMQSITFGRHWQLNPIGTFGAAWGDSGLHNETFWLGWSAVAQYGWNPGAAPVDQHVAEFMQLYYGPRAEGMAGIYEAMQRQARSYERTWDRQVSKMRGPGYGNSYGKGVGTARSDSMLLPPPLPAMPDLKFTPVIMEKYAGFVEIARARQPENARLVMELQTNLGKADRNRYNLEVYLSLARFMGHHWRLLAGMAEAERSLGAAQEAAAKKEPRRAVGMMVAAYNNIERLRAEGEKTFAELTAVWEKSRFPKGQTVNGRKFVHVLDDTKDHFADRTPDLSYLQAAERAIGLDKWTKSFYGVIQDYAKANNVPVRGLAEARLEE